MHQCSPRVSIGLPVYNGEMYLARALGSLLAQTLTDFELIISDNASTDATEAICREYAARDKRIRYYRREQNLGAAWNFNQTFELAQGTYFKWACHDDLYAPEFLERCVEVLDARPDVLVAHSRMAIIDEYDNVLLRYDVTLRTDSPVPHVRFYDMIRTWHRHIQTHGVMRAGALRATRLIGNYADSDVALLARLTLLGRIAEIPDYLTFYRYHPHQSMQLRRLERTEWFDPAAKGKVLFPESRLYYELFLCVTQIAMPVAQRIRCLLYLVCWPLWEPHWHHFIKDMVRAMVQIVLLLRSRTITTLLRAS